MLKIAALLKLGGLAIAHSGWELSLAHICSGPGDSLAQRSADRICLTQAIKENLTIALGFVFFVSKDVCSDNSLLIWKNHIRINRAKQADF